jgi:hypothetical protein
VSEVIINYAEKHNLAAAYSKRRGILVPEKNANNREYRGWPVETGSYPTAHTTIQSFQTANPSADAK